MTKKNQKKKTESDSNIIRQTKKQKIIIQTPKMVVPFGVKKFVNDNGKKSYQMCLSFSTLTNLYNEEEIKKFYFFIQKIDTVNEETIMDYKKTWGLPKNLKYRKTLQRLSNDYPYYMNINLPYDDKHGFLFHTYDEKANKSSIDIIEKKSIVSVVMELTDLKFTDTEFRSNWTVMQLRKFKPYSPIQEFFMSGCFICDEDDPEDTAYLQLIEKYKKSLQTPLPKIPQINPNYYQIMPYQIPNTYMIPPINIPTPPSQNKQSTFPEITASCFKPPSLEELISAKKMLKKTKTVVKGFLQNNSDQKETDKIPSPPSPPLINININKESKNKINSETKKTVKKSKQHEKNNSDNKKISHELKQHKSNSDEINKLPKNKTTSKNNK